MLDSYAGRLARKKKEEKVILAFQYSIKKAPDLGAFKF